MEKTENIPPIYQDYQNIYIHIDIRRSNGQYQMFLKCEEANIGGDDTKFSIDMTPEDLRGLNKNMTDAFRKFAFSETDQERHIKELADMGFYAFNRIFHTNEKGKGLFLKLLSAFDSATIEITTRDFFLPWELLYIKKTENEVSPYNFLGANHIISRFIKLKDTFISPYIDRPKPNIGLLTDSGLEYVQMKEIPFFEDLSSKERITLLKLILLDPADRQKGIRDFEYFLTNNQLDVAHFACHAIGNPKDHELSYMKLSEGFKITMRDLIMLGGFRLGDNPIVILNACNTGVIDSMHASSFAKFFHEFGARGVIATDCEVPDRFAAEFTERFYLEFMGGASLGKALFNTRRYFIEKFSNLTVLIYSMYATPIIRITNRQITLWQGEQYE